MATDLESRQADIEVTPEMVETGREVLEESGYIEYPDPGLSQLTRQVFAAMIRECRAQ